MYANNLSDDYLVATTKDMQERGWSSVDFVLVSGDAYVDHPSFGAAVIGRVLEAAGFRIAVLAQPDWRLSESFTKYGRPRLGFLVTAGNLDSMVAHYSVSKHRRSQDDYSPGGKAGMRPDRATIVYCQRIREIYGAIPLIIGGIEASLRRLAHYDYWDDKVRKSILADSGADLLVYGMGERAIREIARLLDREVPIESIRKIRGTAFLSRDASGTEGFVTIPAFREVAKDKSRFAKSFAMQMLEQDPINGCGLRQDHPEGWIIQNPPAKPLSQPELDAVFDLPYQRQPHPMYQNEGVPAIIEVSHSLISSRGCFGNCSFCALSYHQGRLVQSRSHKSLIDEAEKVISGESFKGYIHDVGGPTANFRLAACKKQLDDGACRHKQCLSPKPCSQLIINHQDYLGLLRRLRALPGVKKVFIRSGIRYDYLMADKDKSFLKELCQHHVSGQLKVAPEHVDEDVLKLMGKPSAEVFTAFKNAFDAMNKKLGKEQYLVPYLMSSHPGSTLASAIKLALFLKQINYHPEQVQDFYPTPGTLSTAMYWTGLDPRTMQPVHIPRHKGEKAMQRALLQYHQPQNRPLVIAALKKAGREDLIGFGDKCLLRPEIIRRNIEKKSTPVEKEKPTLAGRKKRPAKNAKKGKKSGY
jgi:uncharacterized radical SAM protein YgiQ